MIKIDSAGSLVAIELSTESGYLVDKNRRVLFSLAKQEVNIQIGDEKDNTSIDCKLENLLIDGSTPTSFSELKTLLTSVFPNANSGSGGSGGGTILQSPNDTLWQVQVNNSGVLETVQVTSGTAGTLHLFSPDNTEWNVTVNNSGALTTTAI